MTKLNHSILLETKNEILISVDIQTLAKRMVWLPKSQIIILNERTIEVPEWILRSRENRIANTFPNPLSLKFLWKEKQGANLSKF